MSAIGGGFGLPGKVRCCFLLFKNCSGWVLQHGFGLGGGIMFMCCDAGFLGGVSPFPMALGGFIYFVGFPPICHECHFACMGY